MNEGANRLGQLGGDDLEETPAGRREPDVTADDRHGTMDGAINLGLCSQTSSFIAIHLPSKMRKARRHDDDNDYFPRG
jgi:hypothetical protein